MAGAGCGASFWPQRLHSKPKIFAIDTPHKTPQCSTPVGLSEVTALRLL
jgi:hypothetical protein